MIPMLFCLSVILSLTLVPLSFPLRSSLSGVPFSFPVRTLQWYCYMFCKMPRLLLQLLAAGLYLSGLSLAARSTVTVWIATGTCPAIGSLLHPSETVVQYSTTDSAGSYYLTSTTEGLSTSFDTYTTTNSAGSTYVTTVSTLVPEPLTTPSVVTSVYTSTTTDASGHTIVTTGTKTITPASHTGTATSGSIPKATGRSPCPAALAEAYAADDGAEWQLICNSAFYYDDLPATNATSLADCITSCDSYVPMEDDPVYGSKGCVAVTFTDQIVSGANCFRKYSIQQVVYGTSPFDSAKLANYSLSPSISVSVVSSSAGPTGTGTTTSSSVTPTYTSYEPVMPCPVRRKVSKATECRLLTLYRLRMAPTTSIQMATVTFTIYNAASRICTTTCLRSSPIASKAASLLATHGFRTKGTASATTSLASLLRIQHTIRTIQHSIIATG